MQYYAGITAKCAVGPAGKPCDGKESGQCTGEITLTQLDAATCKIEYDLKGATPGDHGEPHDYALGSGLFQRFQQESLRAGFQTVNFMGTAVNMNGQTKVYPKDNYQVRRF